MTTVQTTEFHPGETRHHSSWRVWLFWILVIALIWFIDKNSAQIKELGQTLLQGKWQWLILAAIIQGIYYIFYTWLFQAAFYTVEVESRVFHLIPVVLSALFLNVITPSGGASGAALFVDDAAQRGQSAARTAAGTVLALIADYFTFTLVLLAGLIFLFINHDLQTYEVVGSIILLFIFLGLVTILFLGLWNPNLLQSLLKFIQTWVSRLFGLFKRQSPLDDDWYITTTEEFAAAGTAIRSHPSRLGRTLLIAMAAQFIDITSLYFIFRAFDGNIGFGVLVAGFAVGILFWIVSITPQGIGVVEGVMALTYTSLGVPSAIATAVTLSFRGLTFWIPVLVGFFMLRRTKTFKSSLQIPQDWSLQLVSFFTAIMGLINVISAITPSLADRVQFLEQYLPLAVRHGSHLAAATAGFALLMLSGGLRRGKRSAWVLSVAGLIISMASHLIKGLDYEEALLAGLLLAWLWISRNQFKARSDPPSVRVGVQAIIAALAFTILYGTLGFYLLDRHFKVNFDLWAAFRQTIIMFTQFYNPGLEPITGFGRFFAGSIYGVSAITMAYGLFMLARPVLVHPSDKAEDRARAEQIVQAYGRTSLARAALFNDKIYHFSSGGSVIAFAQRGRVAIALGDPIGPPEDLSAAIGGFQALCATNDWLPAFYQTQPDTLDAYRTAGLDAMKIGDEAIVDLASFSLEGHANKSIRSGYNRLMRLNYSTHVYKPPLDDALMAELVAISQAWLTQMHGSEKRFSLGWFNDEYIRNSTVFVVQNAQGRPTAFANLIPEYTRNETSIDLMRYRPEAEPGTMDFLFAELFTWARNQGFATFNLGLSSLAGVGEHSNDPLVEKGLHFVYEHVNQFYNFKGLHEFKEKFHPQWSPRYLVYPGAASLPAIAAALILIDSGD